MRSSFLVLLLFMLLASSRLPAMEVIDSANLAQNMQTALESVQQTQQLLQAYQLQLQQYQNMLTNTLNPSAWGFGELQGTLQDFMSLKSSLQGQFTQLQNLQNSFNLDSLLVSSGSTDGTGSVNYSSISGASSMSQALESYGQENAAHYDKAEMAAVGRGLEDASLKSVVELVEKQQEDLNDFSERLQTLTSRAQSAQGQQEAIQIQTEVLTMLIELQAKTLALMQAAEVRAATEEKKKVEEEKRNEKLVREMMTFPARTRNEGTLKFPGE